MRHLEPLEIKRFSADPLETVEYSNDIDYAGDGARAHRLDVIRPAGDRTALPIYVYFHGGGWTSGDKAALTRYAAMQAEAGMVVVNANYRMAPRHHMRHLLEDADAVLAWVREHAADFGGDPERIVLGGDSAGGQLSALYAAAVCDERLAVHYGLTPALDRSALRGVVQHCSAVDFSVVFERGFILGMGFVRMLLPGRGRGQNLRQAVRFISPAAWISPDYPPVLVTTSERDFFYRANLNFIATLRANGVSVSALVSQEAQHTWQQDTRHPGSREVYDRVAAFVDQVCLEPHPTAAIV
jgi:acetyl esterase/lipase